MEDSNQTHSTLVENRADVVSDAFSNIRLGGHWFSGKFPKTENWTETKWSLIEGRVAFKQAHQKEDIRTDRQKDDKLATPKRRH